MSTAEKIRYVMTSHSIDNVFDYCPRKFEFLNLRDIRPPRDSGYAADVGTALHDGTQAWLIARSSGIDEHQAQRLGFMAMLRAFPWLEEPLQKTKTRSLDNTMVLLQEIFNSPIWHEWELMPVEGRGWAVEVPWLIRHTSLGSFYIKALNERAMLATQGKIDFIMRHRTSGAIRTFDLKTTIHGPGVARGEYGFSGQQVGYSNIMQAMLGQKTLVAMDVYYIIARFANEDSPTVEMLEVAKYQEDFDDYWLTKVDRLKRMIQYAEQDWFPRTNGGCHAWGQECKFFDVCHTRDNSLINRFFGEIETVPQSGYDYWVTLDV